MGALLALAFWLSLAALLLTLIRLWLLALLIWGMPTYGAIVLGWSAAHASGNAPLGLAVAVLVQGVLVACMKRALAIALAAWRSV